MRCPFGHHRRVLSIMVMVPEGSKDTHSQNRVVMLLRMRANNRTGPGTVVLRRTLRLARSWLGNRTRKPRKQTRGSQPVSGRVRPPGCRITKLAHCCRIAAFNAVRTIAATGCTIKSQTSQVGTRGDRPRPTMPVEGRSATGELVQGDFQPEYRGARTVASMGRCHCAHRT
jgi:hypothetical protein